MLNWKRYGILTGLFLLAIFLQYGVLNNLGWGVLCPQLLIFFPIFGGVLEGSKSGLIFGILVGLMQDLVIGRFIGLNVLVWALIGGGIGIFSARFFKENYLIPVVTVIVCYALSCLLYAGLVGILGGYLISATRLFQIIIGGVLTNGIVAPIVYLPAYRSLNYGLLRKRYLEDNIS